MTTKGTLGWSAKSMLVGSAVLASACTGRSGGTPTDSIAARRSAIIFDDDGRVDTSQIASLPFTAAQQANFRTVANATAILVDQSAVNCPASGACTLTIGAPTFNALPLCSDQKFAGQQAMIPPTATTDGRNCDAFLVAPNLMVTNGACFGAADPGLPFACLSSKAVFGVDMG